MTNSILKTVFLFFLANHLFAQTSGSFEFTITQTPHSTVHGTKHNLAVWFQTESGQLPEDSDEFTNISLVWNPVASLNEIEGNEVVVFPNPSNTDVLTINF